MILTIKGPGWEDLQDAELARLPAEGDPIETPYGTCIVTQSEATPQAETYAGKVVCRLPG